MRWRLRGYDGLHLVWEDWAPGTLSGRQAMQLLARLQCRHLTDAEVLSFTARGRGPDKLSELVVPMNMGAGGFMTTLTPHYTARLEDAPTGRRCRRAAPA